MITKTPLGAIHHLLINALIVEICREIPLNDLEALQPSLLDNTTLGFVSSEDLRQLMNLTFTQVESDVTDKAEAQNEARLQNLN